jgi:hypothetical protein
MALICSRALAALGKGLNATSLHSLPNRSMSLRVVCVCVCVCVRVHIAVSSKCCGACTKPKFYLGAPSAGLIMPRRALPRKQS